MSWKLSQVWDPDRKMALPLPSVSHPGLFAKGCKGPVAPALALTVTDADADLVVSATLVAVTEKVPAVTPALYTPDAETMPPVALQVTAVLDVPVTVALNCCVAPACNDVEVGEIVTTTGGAVAVSTTMFEVIPFREAVILVEPLAATAVARPVALMVATAGVEECQVELAVRS